MEDKNKILNLVTDKNIVIFGGTGGLGKKILSSFYKNNNIIYTFKDFAKQRTLSKKILKKKNYLKIPIKCNVENEKDIFSVVKLANKKFKKIDIVINCTGIFEYDDITKSNYNSLVKTFKINALSNIIINKNLIKFHKSNNFIKVISIGSSSALSGFKDTVAYCGSKHALLGITKALNQTIYKKKILNYCLNSGSIKNKMGKKVKNADYKNFINEIEIIKSINFIISLGERGVPEDMYLKRF